MIRVLFWLLGLLLGSALKRVLLGAGPALGGLAVADDELAGRRTLGGGDLLLRGRLHTRPEAAQRAEHHLGRHRGLLPGAHRVGGRHRLARLAGLGVLPHHLPVDTAALLAPVDEVPR